MDTMYDDLIVGCGSAGAALATRLSEDPKRKVVVLEAGPDYKTIEATPRDIASGSSMSFHDHDWGFRAHIGSGRQIRFPRGKVTGGSSAVGATIALRGMPHDYARWAALGNPTWAWDSVLPYFRRLEDDQDFAGEYHGTGGPIPIRRWRPEELTPVQRAFSAACVKAGFGVAKDHNDPTATGVGPIPSNRSDAATRATTATGYLSTARWRPNLTIHSRVLVNRVVFDGQRASGVELTNSDGTTETLRAKRVILSAGSVATPTLLMRSGIGPSQELKRVGITVRTDLSGVGENLIDHPRSGVFLRPRPGTWNTEDAFLQEILRTTRPGSSLANDMQYYMINHFDLTYFPELQMISGTNVITGVMVCHQRPQSRGRLTLSSADPNAAPEIDLNFLSTDDDIEAMTAGIRTCWELVNHEGIRDSAEEVLILRDSMIDNDEMIRFYLQSSLDSTYHPVGTARMGAPDDRGAVVDQHGAVYGSESLFVMDASIMPDIVSCNTNLTSIMIGEKGAEFLRGL